MPYRAIPAKRERSDTSLSFLRTVRTRSTRAPPSRPGLVVNPNRAPPARGRGARLPLRSAIDRDELETHVPDTADDPGQGPEGGGLVTAAVVHQDDRAG